MDNRVVELALDALKARRTAIEKEIAEIEAELRGRRRRGPAKATRAGNLQSERMKAYWARKRAASGKPSGKAKAGVIRKSGPQSAAARKAVSERMKAYWAKRRAAAAKTAKESKS